MKLFLLALILAVFGSSLGAITFGTFDHPARPGKCVYGDFIVSHGESKAFSETEGKCIRLNCSADKDFSTIHSCGVQGVRAPCKLGDRINPELPYPKCCKKHVICP